MPFVNRDEAGRRLGERMSELALLDPVVLALPRGGVPVGARVAEALGAPLDVIVVRKLGVPFQPELAMGAIGEDGVRVLDAEVVGAAGISGQELQTVEARERAELERRAERYRAGRPRTPLAGHTAVIVDDGMATGSTARAACLVARAHGATAVVMAAPVASEHAVHQLDGVADDVVTLEVPEPFFAVGQWYLRFDQTTDEDVVALLASARDRSAARTPAYVGQGRRMPRAAARASGERPGAERRPERLRREEDPIGIDVKLDLDGSTLGGRLAIPSQASGVVVFAHGSGSGRHSPRNRYVADVLNQAGLATLLFDLLTPDEEQWRPNVFDIPLLGARLLGATEWLATRAEAAHLPVGYFGASTGAAAALWAAARSDPPVKAVVSRGGRPDLAGDSLPVVTAPTLLIVGARDEAVLKLNQLARSKMTCETRLVVVPRATHLFTEPGTLEAVAELAEDWFEEQLPARRSVHQSSG